MMSAILYNKQQHRYYKSVQQYLHYIRQHMCTELHCNQKPRGQYRNYYFQKFQFSFNQPIFAGPRGRTPADILHTECLSSRPVS